MHKFVKKTALLFIISLFSFIVIIALLSIYRSFTKINNKTYRATALVYYVIDKAGHNSERQNVYLGDSVCNQLWPYDQDSENASHLSSTQAITTAGTYLLLKEYLEHNPQTKEVYYIVRPDTLCNDLPLNFTYQYFVLPFLSDDNNINLLEKETRDMLYQKFGKLFVRNSFVKNLLMNNDTLMKIYLLIVQGQQEKKYVHRISPTSIIYLNKIRELCKEHNVKFYMRTLPLADISSNYGWDEFANDIKDNGFEDLFVDFVERIHYYPEDWFSDKMHFKNEILEQYRDDIANTVLNLK